MSKSGQNAEPLEGREGRINALRQLLAQSDSVAIEYADGLISLKDYSETKEQRRAWLEELLLHEAEQGNMPVKEIIKKLISLKIAGTHSSLEVYLEKNPLESKAHGNKKAKYTISTSKQSRLTSKMVMAEGADKYGIPFPIKWNSTGNPCEEWTLPELTQLSFEIATKVIPLQMYQQDLEVALEKMSADPKTTLEDVKSFVIDYSVVAP